MAGGGGLLTALPVDGPVEPVTEPLTAATYLGANTTAPLRELLARVRATTGMRTSIVASDDGLWSSGDAEAAGAGVDLIWICGRLLATLRSTGRLNHDVVAAPVFDGETDAVYRSVIVVRPDGPTSMVETLSTRPPLTLAVNEPQSWSGHHGLRRYIDSAGLSPAWFAREVVTGSHVASIRAVADGEADCAAIDDSLWRHLERSQPELTASVRPMATTDEWPAPPLALSPRLASTRRDAVVQSILTGADVSGVVAFVSAESSTYDSMLD